MQRDPANAAIAASWALLALSVALYLTLAPSTLAALGIPYELPGGSGFAKLHPGTYTLLLSLALGLTAHGNALGVALEMARARPMVTVHLVCMLAVGGWALWRHGASGGAFIIDTLWMPGMALFTMALHPRHRHRQLLVLVGVLLGLNGVMALVEYGLGHTLIPQNVGREDLQPDDYFRASALLGHPLSNALIVGSLMPLVAYLPWGLAARAALAGVLLMSMLAFGGRTSTGMAVLLYGGAGLLGLAWRAANGAFSYRQWLGGLLAGMLVLSALVGVVLATGLGERIFANLVWDNSANVRLVVWRALDHLDTVDWWIGVSPNRMADIAARIGLDLRYEAIENFWIALLMQVGIFGFVPFVIGLASGVGYCWRISSLPMRLGVLLFFVVGSGANTLASKTVSLSLLLITAQAAAAYRPRPAAERPPQPQARPARGHRAWA